MLDLPAGGSVIAGTMLINNQARKHDLLGRRREPRRMSFSANQQLLEMADSLQFHDFGIENLTRLYAPLLTEETDEHR